MSKAIKIKLEKAAEEYDYGKSKFFGDPTLPNEWSAAFDDEVMFLGQIRLEEIADLDEENRLPHTGYLYFFLDTAAYPYNVQVKYYSGEPDALVGDFNADAPEYEDLGDMTQAYIMSFEECEEDEECTRLFGVPSSDYEPCEGQDEALLLQFDPLDNETGFLSAIDGYAYIFCDTNKEEIDEETEFVIERY